MGLIYSIPAHLPVLSFQDLLVHSPATPTQNVQLLLKKRSIRRRQLSDYLLSVAAQHGQCRLVAGQAFLQLLTWVKMRV